MIVGLGEILWDVFPDGPRFGGRSSGAIRQGDWKLIELFDTGTIELYNLAHDPGKQHNLAHKYPDKTADLTRLVAAPPRRFSDHAEENGRACSGKNGRATRAGGAGN